MKKTWRLLPLTSLLWIAVCVSASHAQPSATTANPRPRTTATPSSPVDDDLQTQEQIIAELKALRGEKAGWQIERTGLEGQIGVWKEKYEVQKERADFFRLAATTGQTIDKNSQAIEAKSEQQIAYLRTDLATTQRKLTETEGKLDSCRDSRKYIAILGAGAGFAAGWWTKGKSQTLGFTARSVAEQQILKPIADSRNFGLVFPK